MSQQTWSAAWIGIAFSMGDWFPVNDWKYWALLVSLSAAYALMPKIWPWLAQPT